MFLLSGQGGSHVHCLKWTAYSYALLLLVVAIVVVVFSEVHMIPRDLK